MEPLLSDGTQPASPAANRSRWLAILCLAAGALSLIVGASVALAGLGFANATACGSGLGLAVTGVWMMLAYKGLSRRRRLTYLGLGLAWTWLFVRIFLDFPAVGSAAILFLFLIPGISLPIGLMWALLVLASGLGGVTRLARMLRGREIGPWPRRSAWVTGGLLGLLVLTTYAMPELSWNFRGQRIQQLGTKYSAATPRRTAPVTFGACSMSFLGYSLTQHGAENTGEERARQEIFERALADAEAELASVKAAGARYFRLGASGDQLLVSKPRQEEIDERYMAAVQRSGLGVVLVDTQHPEVCKKRKLTWAEFCQFQKDRIGYYQKRYHPAVYIVVCEPMSYHRFALTPATRYSAADWGNQLSDMCRLVKSINPATRTGICLLVMKDKGPEWEVWSRMKNLPELDILSVEIYQPEDFASTEERLKKFGHPHATGKQLWIAETYNGWALNGARRWDQDAAWLKVSRDFARAVDAETVLVWTFGTFVPGGSFWDFGRGKLRQKWGAGGRLSVVGEAFRSVSASAN